MVKEKLKILIVDDSVVFRSQIKASLSDISEIEVVGTANNGKIALTALQKQNVDIVTLDLEMPEMDGLETLRQIKKHNIKTKVIVFSANTSRGANQTISALELGAVDVVTKPSGKITSLDSAKEQIKKDLVPKILQFAGISKRTSMASVASSQTKASVSTKTQMVSSSGVKAEPKIAKKNLSFFRPEIIIIGSSTGGPLALEHLFAKIPKETKIPIMIAQHMPPIFTNSLAKRLSQLTGLQVEEGKHGEVLQGNRVYVAPGDYHMTIKEDGLKKVICLDQKDKRNSVRPAVDYLFESVSPIYKDKVLAYILTGMGSDGTDGCKAVKQNEGGVIIQDEESSVVWGMPGSVYQNGCYDKISSINECADSLSLFLK